MSRCPRRQYASFDIPCGATSARIPECLAIRSSSEARYIRTAHRSLVEHEENQTVLLGEQFVVVSAQSCCIGLARD